MFTPDGTRIIASGPAGFSFLEMATGRILGGQIMEGSSGIIGIAISPDGMNLANITRNSVHVFSLQNGQHVESYAHKTHGTTGVAIWSEKGVLLGGADGLLHHKGSGDGIPQTHATACFGNWSVTLHDQIAAVWNKNERTSIFDTKFKADRATVNRDGTLLLLEAENQPFRLFGLKRQKELLKGGPEEIGIGSLGGSTVLMHLNTGGVKWWNLAQGAAFQLPWPKHAALSHGGDLLSAITPQGKIRILKTYIVQPNIK